MAKTKKEKAIETYLALPIKVGDEIHIKGMNSRSPDQESLETVEKIDKTMI